MASSAAASAAEASLKREKLYTGLILLLFLIAFGIVFKPVRLAPKEGEFHSAYFTYRYPNAIGPGERPKEEVRAAIEKKLTEKDVAPDSRITFPTTTEIKIRVPLQHASEAEAVAKTLSEILDEVVPERYGKKTASPPDLSDFPQPPLAALGPLALYRPAFHMRLGLDLQGGVHLVLKARTQNVEFEYRLAENAQQLIAALDAADAKEAQAGATTASPASPTEAPVAAGPSASDPAAPPAAEAPANPAEPATSPDGGRPLRMAQAPADGGAEDAPADTADESAGDEELESLEEREVSPDEAKLLSDEQLRRRVVDRITAFTLQLRQQYGERIGDVYGEVVSSNIAVFRTHVGAKGPEGAEIRAAHAKILTAELQKIFPQAKAKLAEPREIEIPQDAMRQVKDVIMLRIDRLGVSEAEVRTQGTDRVVVELPGIKDPDEAVALIGTTARLEFRKVPPRYRPEVVQTGSREETTFVLKSTGETVPTTLVYYEAPEFEGDKNILVGSDLRRGSANVHFTQQNQPAVGLTLRPDAAKRFDRFAQDNYKEYLAIYLDRQVISAPEMQARAFNGQVQISGGFETIEEAKQLQILLNAGALPVPVDVVEQRAVSATLGADAVRQSSNAGLWGLVLILVLMVGMYRLPGLLADIALFGYVLLTLALLIMCNATLTLPGILGLILSIGMAVDANVIIFERLKEELRESASRSMPAATRNAYDRSRAAIYDGNTTTLLIAAVLFFMGTGPIKGFAVTLSLGIVCSMFTALVVTRRFQNLSAATAVGQDRRFYRC